MIITCFNVGSVVSLLTCFPLMIIDRQYLAVKSTFSCSILSMTFFDFLVDTFWIFNCNCNANALAFSIQFNFIRSRTNYSFISAHTPPLITRTAELILYWLIMVVRRTAFTTRRIRIPEFLSTTASDGYNQSRTIALANNLADVKVNFYFLSLVRFWL